MKYPVLILEAMIEKPQSAPPLSPNSQPAIRVADETDMEAVCDRIFKKGENLMSLLSDRTAVQQMQDILTDVRLVKSLVVGARNQRDESGVGLKRYLRDVDFRDFIDHVFSPFVDERHGFSVQYFVQPRVPKHLRIDSREFESLLQNLVEYIHLNSGRKTISVKFILRMKKEDQVELQISVGTEWNIQRADDRLLVQFGAQQTLPEHESVKANQRLQTIQAASRNLEADLWFDLRDGNPDLAAARVELKRVSDQDISEPESSSEWSGLPNVLIVMPDTFQRADLNKIIQDNNVPTRIAATFSEINQTLEDYLSRNENLGMVIIDVTNPGIDGYRICSLFKNHFRYSSVPIILIGHDNMASRGKAINSGSNAFLAKPYSKGALNRAVSESRFGQGGVSRMKKDINAARDYVRSLLPSPIDEPIKIDWRYYPAADLAGDSFGFHWLNADTCAFYLFDVFGHGIDSSLLSVSILNSVKSMSLRDVNYTDPGDVLVGLNRHFPMEQHGDRCFTAWYGIYNLPQQEILWAGGGHPSALLFSDGEVKPLKSTGPLVGMMEDSEFSTNAIKIQPEDRLLLLSDGVFEVNSRNGTPGEFDDFVAHAKSHCQSDALLDDLRKRAVSIRGEAQLEDDFSLLDIQF